MSSTPRQRADAISQRITQAGGRATEIRRRVLGLLLRARQPLTHSEIEQAAAREGSFDRVTLYRTLDWLVGHGLAHRISGADRVWRFNAADDEAHGHAHFHCTSCGQVYCLDELVPSVAVSLPRGFRFERAALSIEGACPRCARD